MIDPYWQDEDLSFVPLVGKFCLHGGIAAFARRVRRRYARSL